MRARTIIESADFDRWFAGSKAVDQDGAPKRVFHGTPNPGFSEFDSGKRGTNHDTLAARKAFWFASDPETSDYFSQQYGGGATYPSFLRITNPLIVDHSGLTSLELVNRGHTLRNDAVNKARRSGKDAVIFRNSFEAGNRCDIFAVFSPDQIRSSIGARAVIESADFDRWFRGSKVIDAAGNPLRVYHGTAPSSWSWNSETQETDFHGTSFDRFNGPSYFAANPKYAEGFAQAQANERAMGNGARMIPAYLSAKNPADMRGDPDYWKKLRSNQRSEIARLKAAGYDSVILSEVNPKTHPHLTGDVWFVFEPDQVRNAIGSRLTQLA